MVARLALNPAPMAISTQTTQNGLQSTVKKVNGSLIAAKGSRKVSRFALEKIPAPPAIDRHKPIPHIELVEALIYCLLGKRYQILKEEYVLSKNNQKLFGMLILENSFDGGQLAVGFRHSNDKQIALALIAGYQVTICSNMAMFGNYLPVLRKHTSGLVLTDAILTGVEKIEHKFWDPMVQQIKLWQQTPLADIQAREIIYESFLEQRIAPVNLIDEVHMNYFDNPVEKYREAFGERTLWSLSNAYTEAFKKLSSLSQYKSTELLARFLDRYSTKPIIDIDAKAVLVDE